MIKFEHGMLVLNNAFTKEDIEHINAFTGYVRNQERESIVKMLEELTQSRSGINLQGAIALIKDKGPQHLKDLEELCDND